jgi:hypothetical protein
VVDVALHVLPKPTDELACTVELDLRRLDSLDDFTDSEISVGEAEGLGAAKLGH